MLNYHHKIILYLIYLDIIHKNYALVENKREQVGLQEEKSGIKEGRRQISETRKQYLLIDLQIGLLLDFYH